MPPDAQRAAAGEGVHRAHREPSPARNGRAFGSGIENTGIGAAIGINR